MLAFFAALLAAAPMPVTPATAASAPVPEATDLLDAASPWWEKITVTVDPKGTQQSCRYETSSAGSVACDEAMAASVGSGKGSAGLFRKVTFERRFTPGAASLDAGKLQPGDMLLGRQVMFLTIDAKGAILGCKVVATAGDAPPDYDCDEVRKEQFRAEGSADGTARQAFMTVLAYGHTESIA